MPDRLMPTMRSQASVDTLKKLRFGSLMPALLMRMSMRPMRSAAWLTALRLDTSSAIASQLPSAFTCRSAAARVSRLRPERITCAPARASSIAPASPMPEPPPVIQATLPLGILRRTEEDLGLLLGEARRRAAALGEHFQRLLHRRAAGDLVAPLAHARKVLDVHALALGSAQPRHDRHVGDGVLVAG